MVTFLFFLRVFIAFELVLAEALRMTPLSLTFPVAVFDAAEAVKAGTFSTGMAVNSIAAASMIVTALLFIRLFLISIMIPTFFIRCELTGALRFAKGRYVSIQIIERRVQRAQ